MQVGTRSIVTKLMKRRTRYPTHPSARGRPHNHSEGAIYLEHDRSPGEGGAIDGRLNGRMEAGSYSDLSQQGCPTNPAHKLFDSVRIIRLRRIEAGHTLQHLRCRTEHPHLAEDCKGL